tara:strand:- start:262 stop:579 length:318 start_codon:yes stop_codon:yes gene_type:complete
MCELKTLNKIILQISQFKKSYNILTIANEKPLFFRDLVEKIAQYNSKKIILLGFPLSLMFYFLKFLEFLEINLKTYSDSLLSLISQKRNVKTINFEDLDVIFPEF